MQYYGQENRWEIAEVVMILKPRKDPTTSGSYTTIYLLPTTSKPFEKLLLMINCLLFRYFGTIIHSYTIKECRKEQTPFLIPVLILKGSVITSLHFTFQKVLIN